MYKYEDFKDNIDLKYFAEAVLYIQNKSKYNQFVARVDLIWYGDSWENLACIDKLEELGFIRAIKSSEDNLTNKTLYRNIKL